MAKIHYSGVVLTPKSQELLIRVARQLFGTRINTWETLCHHMTTCMGSLPIRYAHLKGRKVRLLVTDIGINPLVAAVRVSGFPTKNEIPHVTVAVNRIAGGKPVMSNAIETWKAIDPFVIEGIVEEVPYEEKTPVKKNGQEQAGADDLRGRGQEGESGDRTGEGSLEDHP